MFNATSDCRTAFIKLFRSSEFDVVLKSVPNATRVLNTASDSFRRGNNENIAFRHSILPRVSLYLFRATVKFNI